MSKLSPILGFTLLSLLLLSGGLGLTASAQQFTGTLQGSVRDSSGAVVAGAEVAIANQNTNVTINMITGGNDWRSAANWLAGGWQFNGIVTFQSGLPILITQGANNVGLFNPSQRPTWNGTDPNREGGKSDKLAQWFDKSAFTITPAFTFGNTPRVMPDLRQDGEKNFDLSLFKNNYFSEGKRNLQFRVEFFNAFNRVRFAGPNGQVDNNAFGTVSGQGNGPRQIQFALKLMM